MNPQELIGRTVTNIFETEPSLVQDGIPGLASFFYIVIELDGCDVYELGAHEVYNWTKTNTLMAIKNDPDIIGQKIVRVIQKDFEENYDGSLILVLESNFTIEHVTTNGDQLCFSKFEEET